MSTTTTSTAYAVDSAGDSLTLVALLGGVELIDKLKVGFEVLLALPRHPSGGDGALAFASGGELSIAKVHEGAFHWFPKAINELVAEGGYSKLLP